MFHTFAALMFYGQVPGNPTSNITSLGNISALKAESFHQLIQHTSNITYFKVPIQWGSRRKGVTWQ
jgi:hypothetical protein